MAEAPARITAKILGSTAQRLEPLRLTARARVRADVEALAPIHAAELSAELLAYAVETMIDLIHTWPEDTLAVDGRIRIPVPWGRNGHALAGLTRTEGEILNRYMRILSHREPDALFVYDDEARRWHYNLRYDKRTALLVWAESKPDARAILQIRRAIRRNGGRRGRPE